MASFFRTIMKAICTLALASTVFVATTSTTTAAERAAINRRTGLYEPALSDLRKSAERGDRAELARTASRLGPSRLAKALADSDRRTVLAALEAAPLFAEGVLLLDAIVSLLGAADEDIRQRAARSTAALFRAHDRTSLVEWEISNETVTAACQALLRVAITESEKAPARLAALQGLADASTYCATAGPLAGLVSNAPADVRRGAVLALPRDGSPVVRNALVAASQDVDGKVAASAGARLCRGQMQAPGAVPLRQLALAREALPEDTVEIVPCLAASKDAADRKALDQLAAGGTPAVKAAIKSLK